MDIPELQKLIDESKILEPSDRTYWHAQLPTMNEAQLTKLHGILSEAAAIQMEKHVHEYFSLLRGNAAPPLVA